ncbi:MAG: HPr family phosphocarrier protein [Clostridia bacterium]|nr:HPr family phosphocarrier protein [Clostridia bacterium]MBO5440446.1 HPr family phosphocarrier protein [Clostridia bacterium]
MEQFTFIIKDKNGMHARPAGAVANCAKKYKSDIKIYKNEKEANAKRLLSLMSLGATYNSEIVIKIEGEDEKEALTDIKNVLSENLSEG